MEANLFLLIGSGVLIACGVYLMLDKSMTRMIMGVTLIGNGANLLLLQNRRAAQVRLPGPRQVRRRANRQSQPLRRRVRAEAIRGPGEGSQGRPRCEVTSRPSPNGCCLRCRT